MLYIQEEQRVTVWQVEDKGKYSLVNMSSARKDKENEGQYINSNWGYTRFVGKAHEKASKLERGDRIALKGAGFTKESYIDKEGNKAYPKSPQLVVFNFSMVNKTRHDEDDEGDEQEAVETYDEDVLPF